MEGVLVLNASNTKPTAQPTSLDFQISRLFWLMFSRFLGLLFSRFLDFLAYVV